MVLHEIWFGETNQITARGGVVLLGCHLSPVASQVNS